jgi:hypothetical protein
MSAASKKTIRKLMPFGVILALGALLGIARGAIVGGGEFKVFVGSNFVDANNYLLFQTSTGGQTNTVEVGSALQVTLGITNITTSTPSFYLTGTITRQDSTALPANAGPTVRFACNAPNGCPINAVATAFDFPTIDGTNAVPGTYLITFTAVDVATNAMSYSSQYSFVISSPAGTLAKNSLTASTLMTINISGTQTLFAAPGGGAVSASSPIDSTTGTATTAAGVFASPVTLILNNVGTSTIVVNDASGNTVTLGAGDVIAAQFVSTVQAHVIEAVPGSLRIGLP